MGQVPVHGNTSSLMVQERSWEKLRRAVIAIQTAQAINTSLGNRGHCAIFVLLLIWAVFCDLNVAR